MKKIAFIILCLIVSINCVKAECQDTEILKWAKDVKVKFDVIDKTTADTTYYKEGCTLGGIALDDNTVIFSVDGMVDLTCEIEEENVSVGTKTALIDRTVYPGYKAYNVNMKNIATVIYGQDLIGTLNYNADFFTIAGVSTSLDSEGLVVNGYKGIAGGEAESVLISPASTVKKLTYAGCLATTWASINDLKKGTVIIYSKDAKGEAKEVVILADIDDLYTDGVIAGTMLGETETFTAGGDDYTFLFGYVSGKSGSAFYVYDEIDYQSGYLVADPYLIISDTTGTVVDPFLNTPAGYVYAAMEGDINCASFDESSSLPEGDIIFAKVKNDIIVEDFVVFRSGN